MPDPTIAGWSQQQLAQFIKSLKFDPPQLPKNVLYTDSSNLPTGGSTVNSIVSNVTGQKLTVSSISSPPSGPVTGDIWFATGVATGKVWQFIYDSTVATYKWLFTGGPAIYIRDNSGLARSGTVNNTWELLPGFGTITVPRTGYYRWFLGSNMAGQNSAVQYMTLGQNTAGVGIIDAFLFDNNNAATVQIPGMYEFDDVGMGGAVRTSGTAYTAQIQSSDVTNSWLYFTHLSCTPIQII